MHDELREVGRFDAVDKNGKKHRIVMKRRFIYTQTNSLSGGPMHLPSNLVLTTVGGENVISTAKGKYEIEGVFGSIPVSSDDPIAP